MCPFLVSKVEKQWVCGKRVRLSDSPFPSSPGLPTSLHRGSAGDAQGCGAAAVVIWLHTPTAAR